VLPVLVLVAFSAVIPLMTVVNYSLQDTFGNNQFFWAGTDWFRQLLASPRFWASMARNLVFSAIILVIEVPLGIFIALNMPKKGLGVPFCLVFMALPLLIPWNVVGTIWQVFGRNDIGLLGYYVNALGSTIIMSSILSMPGSPSSSWTCGTDKSRRAFVLCRAGVDPRRLLSGPRRSTVPRAGPCSATSSFRR